MMPIAMVTRFTTALGCCLSCLIWNGALAQDSFVVPSFPSSVSTGREACGYEQDDLKHLERIQETVRAVNSLLPKPPPEEDAYIRAESNRVFDMYLQGPRSNADIASDALRRRPLFFAWEIRNDAASLQSQIAMQHGYENARRSTPNVDALEAQQALLLLDRAIKLDRSVRNDLQKAASGIGRNEKERMIRSTEWAIRVSQMFVGCKFSRAYYAPKIGAEKQK